LPLDFASGRAGLRVSDFGHLGNIPLEGMWEQVANRVAGQFDSLFEKIVELRSTDSRGRLSLHLQDCFFRFISSDAVAPNFSSPIYRFLVFPQTLLR
jgi:hypothetical protein